MGDEDRAVAHLVVRCAWCERVRVEGGWSPDPMSPAELLTLRARAYVSHSICPTCFGGVSPEVPYPDDCT
jgi:hypothetical protein